jgi:hypothetical protein
MITDELNFEGRRHHFITPSMYSVRIHQLSAVDVHVALCGFQFLTSRPWFYKDSPTSSAELRKYIGNGRAFIGAINRIHLSYMYCLVFTDRVPVDNL